VGFRVYDVYVSGIQLAWLGPMGTGKRELEMKDFGKLEDYFENVENELGYQAVKWADGDLDSLLRMDVDNNDSPMNFVGYVAAHSTRWFPGGFPPYSRETLQEFRRAMTKVAALGISAMRWADAKLEE
jgi:hypothetical protein